MNYCHLINSFTQPEKVSKFICQINGGVLNDPVHDQHGHLFCKNCILDVFGENVEIPCPLKNNEIITSQKLHESKAIKLIIDQQEVYCVNRCGFIGKLGQNSHNCIDFFRKQIEQLETRFLNQRQQTMKVNIESSKMKINYFIKPDKDQRKLMIDENFKGPFIINYSLNQFSLPGKQIVEFSQFKKMNLRLGFHLVGKFTDSTLVMDQNNFYWKQKSVIEEERHEFNELLNCDGEIEFIFDKQKEEQVFFQTTICNTFYEKNLSFDFRESLENIIIEFFYYMNNQLRIRK